MPFAGGFTTKPRTSEGDRYDSPDRFHGAMVSEYKATGKQLEVHPEAKGVPLDKWQKAQSMPTQREVADFIAKREAAASTKKPKTPVKSGALPNNTEGM